MCYCYLHHKYFMIIKMCYCYLHHKYFMIIKMCCCYLHHKYFMIIKMCYCYLHHKYFMIKTQVFLARRIYRTTEERVNAVQPSPCSCFRTVLGLCPVCRTGHVFPSFTLSFPWKKLGANSTVSRCVNDVASQSFTPLLHNTVLSQSVGHVFRASFSASLLF